MVLPFQPLSMSFSNINYYVDVPLVSGLTLFVCTIYSRKHVDYIFSDPSTTAGIEAAGNSRREIAAVG